MAEDITLKGVKVIRYNSDKIGDFTIVNPTRGGDTHKLPQWWDLKKNDVRYIDCTILEIGGNHLVIPTQMQSEIRILWDGSALTFPVWRNIERAALFAPGVYGADNVITDYIFPKVGVRGAKVQVKGSTPPAPPLTIGTVTVSGNATPGTGVNVSYTAGISGSASNLSYSWSVTGTGTITSGTTNPGVTVEFTAGAATVTCQVSDPGASDSPVSGDLNVIAA